MKLSDFDYTLPHERIAQAPARPRDRARMLVLARRDGSLAHRTFRDLPGYLRPGDVLVLNDTRVLPARLRGRRAGGGAVEVLLLRPDGRGAWEALVRPSRRVREGARLVFGDGTLEAVAGPRTDSGTRLVTLSCRGDLRAVLDEVGEMPVPPYIERPLDDPDDYQTVYAEREGAVAAPTAGLHFTDGLLAVLRTQGVDVVFLTLHVGIGTFRAVEAEDVAAHRMDAEWYDVTPQTARAINTARARGARVVVVGTTSVRTLESVAQDDGTVAAGNGWTDLFITPGFRFRVTDALITNFHLPRTTLLMLVSAFAGRDRVLGAYEAAVREGYRFYSFGDAMLIV
ncbi:MAG TPA: tRNA preQ1(34) S-adenosylmethionine ribosyltransferase-isomerase QueA [bacterium]|nr:tRNA preQ1(34) S-adenosylmethionine ribosyltransferase-isomerase QueA [bacterium]